MWLLSLLIVSKCVTVQMKATVKYLSSNVYDALQSVPNFIPTCPRSTGRINLLGTDFPHEKLLF